MVFPHPSIATFAGGRQRALRVLGGVGTWGIFALLLLPYVAIRGKGDELFSPIGFEGLERAAFFGVPTRFLQEHLYTRDMVWLDAFGLAMHLSWFFLPFVFSLVVAFTERKKMLEFYCWVLAASYLSTIFYLLMPVRPPWMEEGITRVLAERSFIEYTQADDNPFAAFPSLHAAIPMVIAMFFWLRSERGTALALPLAIHGLLISAAVVYLGEHWVLDVLAGWAMAGVVAWLFVSPGVRAALQRIPGDPLRRVQELDARIVALGNEVDQQTPGPADPERLPRAA
ncbi:MAG TPA: phosphatase PAP2 family protein [Tepidiformaceae bacterium]|nr:phosphatase PAP2 family protein [Tepidiformaceae bacterium]